MVSAIRTAALPVLISAFLIAGATRADELRGTVRDALSGKPLAGVVLDLDQTAHQATSTREGAFSIPGAPAGALRLRASLAGYRRAEVLVPAKGEPVDLTLEPLLVRLDEAVTVTAQGRALPGEAASMGPENKRGRTQ